MQATHRSCRACLAALILTGAALAASPANAQTATFNFDADAVGTATTFTDTNNGISATFTSPGVPAGFIVIPIPPAFFSTLSGNALTDPGPLNVNNIPLDILFSAPLKSFSLNYATAGVSPFVANFYKGGLGGTLVGSSTTTSAIPMGKFIPEGALSFTTTSSFDTVTLNATAASDFIVDNIVVTGAPVPEASTTASFGLLLALGLGGVVVAGRRKKTQPTS